jgi:predicted transcriptional regulator
VTTKERLHQLVDELSESEANDALRYVASRREDPLIRRLDSAPLEDEEISVEEEAAAAEGRADIAAGRTVSHEEMLRKYG